MIIDLKFLSDNLKNTIAAGNAARTLVATAWANLIRLQKQCVMLQKKQEQNSSAISALEVKSYNLMTIQ